MSKWANEAVPKSAVPKSLCMLTAILQTTARENGIAIDTLSWDFPVFRHGDVSQITKAAEVGMYVHGLFLEGARWDTENSCLADATPMELTSSMPIIHFKPIDTKKQLKGTFSCPLYLYPIRTGTRLATAYFVEAISYLHKCNIIYRDFKVNLHVALIL